MTASQTLVTLGHAMGHRKCAVCQSVRMISDMAPDERMADGYGSVCKSCAENKAERQRYQRSRVIANAFRESVERAQSLARVTDLCNTMLESFGGLKQFCEIWRSQIDLAMERKPGSATVLMQFTSIAKIILAANAANPPKPAVNVNLTEEEILQRLTEIAQRLEIDQVTDTELVAADGGNQ